MDVQTQVREGRIFSILNDNDCPSFVIRPRRSSPPHRLSREERPNLLRQPHYHRASSVSSADSPPLLRQASSSSSKSSSSSMDSSPSPITPVFAYADNNAPVYDPLLRPDLAGYVPSPSTITPFLEQQLMLNPGMPDQFQAAKPIRPMVQPPFPPALPQSPFHHLARPLPTGGLITSLPTTTTAPGDQTSTSPTAGASAAPAKKNKYRCPYAQTHNCQATFTTSGHAARHGKKHTGEKGVRCPVCNKAFTRKDNMKQHERTHRGNGSGNRGDESGRRSKAGVTKDTIKSKRASQGDLAGQATSRRSSLIHSPLSEVTSLAPTVVETPLAVDAATFYPEPASMAMPMPLLQGQASPNPIYAPFGGDALLGQAPSLPPLSLGKTAVGAPGSHPILPPTLIRGFSDLDTLAQAAETFNPYYQPTL